MKDIQKLLKPIVTEFQTEIPDANPEIYNVTYDLWTLKITLGFDDIKSPIYVIFKNVVGFRVLDEGNLLEFWDKDVRVPGWIWRVESGGWFELEKLRAGFLAQHHGDSHNEYLISGINDCLSVIAESEPIIMKAE
ncbi:hypothetical protein L1S34_14455 [Flavobacterium sp. K77]|jgi:hypothetical protein|uniref:Uncharacterized protein n=1 Tax=Flavobacterium bernardetii TaxID=2813823 RepID=A0ABR7IVZ4_9FLAO|nr:MULTISPECIES: hypothetical protein [Flavobacterium]MBC5833932.1 hypothetical protein [Flavobacterium bernardetii]MCF6142056.1 hypothetical protein [Flavobacterium sp. K77]MCF6142064.1 hypothetical protein [Flavobacterium sp. K77]MCF6142494.1 hypothetical protein [Flavobacterium sp. K77]NHF69165.1 hypothetical protein [Flavobacterium bernardetii]